MNTRQEAAVKYFNEGYNCAQSVLATFTDELGFDKNAGLRISAGFGAGMGRLQETCGAVTGAFMAIGIYTTGKFTDNITRKEKTIAMVQDFDREFRKLHKTSNCGELLGCDLKTDEGQKVYADKNLKEAVCYKCVTNAVSILEGMINNPESESFH
jgi:C_GCAxxG_C_C family probable redox protein